MVVLIVFVDVVAMNVFAIIDKSDKDQKYFFVVKKATHYNLIFIILKSMNIVTTEFVYKIFKFIFVFSFIYCKLLH